MIDVRNGYEIDIGHFGGARCAAVHVNPAMRVSTDFPIWAASPDTQAMLEGKQVLMYCTGGIRCERASGLIHELGVQTRGVYQLEGGIEKYLQVFPDGGLWQGRNFAFDKRGNIPRSTTAESAAADAVVGVGSTCCACGTAWHEYRGRRKCAGVPANQSARCGVPVLVCDSCLSAQTPAQSLRCPLCVPRARRGGNWPLVDIATGRLPPAVSTAGKKKKTSMLERRRAQRAAAKAERVAEKATERARIAVAAAAKAGAARSQAVGSEKRRVNKRMRRAERAAAAGCSSDVVQ